CNSGSNASAWPRSMGRLSLATTPPYSVSRTAAEHAASAVSIASTRIVAHAGGQCVGLEVPPIFPGRAERNFKSKSHTRSMMLAGVPFDSEVRTEQAAQSCESNRDAIRKKLHRPHFGHVGQEMAQQVLNAMAQGRRRRRAARAGAFHVQIDDAVLEA